MWIHPAKSPNVWYIVSLLYYHDDMIRQRKPRHTSNSLDKTCRSDILCTIASHGLPSIRKRFRSKSKELWLTLHMTTIRCQEIAASGFAWGLLKLMHSKLAHVSESGEYLGYDRIVHDMHGDRAYTELLQTLPSTLVGWLCGSLICRYGQQW